MKRLSLLLTILLIPASLSAAPFLVCDPQAGVDYYLITGDPYWTTFVPAQPDGSIRSDVAAIGFGGHTIQLQACKAASTTEVGGCSDPTPFTFSKTKPAASVNIRLVP